jgi:hypothetical protein
VNIPGIRELHLKRGVLVPEKLRQAKLHGLSSYLPISGLTFVYRNGLYSLGFASGKPLQIGL